METKSQRGESNGTGINPNRVRLFVKPFCGWCHDAAEWLEARGVPFETLDVQANPVAREEMLRLSGQGFAPVIDVDGKILANFDTDQLAAFWEQLQQAPDSHANR